MLSSDIDLALQLADMADEITMRHFRQRDKDIRIKSDRTLVLAADVEVEAALREVLGERRPNDSILGEEFGYERDSVRRWIIDPLDHTVNFARGLPFFATLIALTDTGGVNAGVVSAPGLDRRWWAARGCGAWSDGGRITVSDVDDPSAAHLSYAALHRWDDLGKTPNIVKLARSCRHCYGSGGFWGHMMVAEGKFDISLDPWGEVWDVAPMQVILEEAGGRLTDVCGRARPDGGTVVATNQLLHDWVIETLDTTDRSG